MVQSTKSREGTNLASGCGTDCNRPTHGRVLREPEMRSVLVVVTYVFSHESFQVSFIQYDHMVQQVSATTSHPTLCDSVLPGTTEGGAHWFAAQVLGHADHGIAELRIAVEEEELLSLRIRPRFAHLLHDPQGARVSCDVDGQNFSPLMSDDEEAIQDAEGKGRHGEEVHRCDSLVMVSQECQPAFDQVGGPGHSLQPS